MHMKQYSICINDTFCLVLDQKKTWYIYKFHGNLGILMNSICVILSHFIHQKLMTTVFHERFTAQLLFFILEALGIFPTCGFCVLSCAGLKFYHLKELLVILDIKKTNWTSLMNSSFAHHWDMLSRCDKLIVISSVHHVIVFHTMNVCRTVTIACISHLPCLDIADWIVIKPSQLWMSWVMKE